MEKIINYLELCFGTNYHVCFDLLEAGGAERRWLVYSQNCLKQTHSSVQKAFKVPDKAESACSRQDDNFVQAFIVAFAAHKYFVHHRNMRADFYRGFHQAEGMEVGEISFDFFWCLKA